MEEILIITEDLSKVGNGEKIILQKQFYKTLSKLTFNEEDELLYFTEYALPKIQILCDNKILQKDIIYLCLLAYNNLNVLEKCVKYDKSIFQLNVTDPNSLYDYSIFKKQHWFYEALRNHATLKDKFNESIYQNILAVKLVELTNVSEISIDDIKNLLESIEVTNVSVFWKNYISEVKYFVKVVEFCKEVTDDLNVSEVFLFLRQNCVLETFSKYLNFANVEWTEILNKIHEEEQLHQSKNDVQSQQFLAFYILGNIIKIVLLEDSDTNVNVNEILDDLKTKLLSLKSKATQINLLENIFATIFIKTSHILHNKTEEEFICKQKQIRLILYFIKMVIDEIKLKSMYDKQSEEYKKLVYLNKLVTDAVWRMELIETIKDPRKCEINLLKYMLARPQSLIQMCLKKGDFKRTYQVIEIFGLKESLLSQEVEYTEKLQNLRKNLNKTLKIWEIQQMNPNISLQTVEPNTKQTIENFFKNNPAPFNFETEQFITKVSEAKPILSHFTHENDKFINMFDIAITQTRHFEHCTDIIRLAYDNNTLNKSIGSTYKDFTDKLFHFWTEIGQKHNLTLLDIVVSPHYNLDLTKYRKQEQFYDNLAQLYEEFNSDLTSEENGVLNSNHPSHKSILKLNLLCNEFVESEKDNVKYVAKLYNYLKAFAKVLYIEQNTSEIVSQGKNTSYFNLLYHNRSELMGKLLFEKHLDPSEFEKYFEKLKLDYLYHVIGNCFPTINLHSQEIVAKEELYPENSLYTPSKSIITYIQKRNWLLAFILSEMHRIEDVKVDISEVRVRPFLNYMKLSKIQCLKVLFDGNEIVAALQNEISTQKLAQYINTKILKNDDIVDMTSSQYSQNSFDSFEAAQEIVEDALKTTNWKELYDIVDSVPENQLRKTPVLVELKDMVLVNLVQDRFEINYFQYVRCISDEDLRVTTILCNIKYWPGEFCSDVIKSEITKFGASQSTRLSELTMWLQQIELCEQLRSILDVPSWSKAFEICENNPIEVISKLVLCDKIQTLLEFIYLHKPSEDLLLQINEDYFIMIFDSLHSHELIRKLLDNLPYDHSINVCYNLLRYLKNLNNLQFVTDYLLNNINDDLLKNIRISLKMLSVFPTNEQEQFLCLIHEPLSIIEILIMNTKLDKLSTVLEIVKCDLEHVEFNENQLSLEKIDSLLRNYAEKSLDFRVITQPNPRLLRTPDCKLMQSIDSLSLCAENRLFTMPEEVPLKSEWVGNTEVLECMCCRKITFSMFNRRHHCRRCGRVVCYNCSTHRMLVSSYEDIPVRVCEDCYHQTVGDSVTSEFTDTASTKSVTYDYWMLSDDSEHNKIVREEFSYEHAPSVSLCLSVMKYHSNSVEYPKFLLDQCDLMLKLLQPSQEPIQEIDYLLVIKMLKSLAVAAKVVSVECSLHYGTSLADRILSQADLLALLAERGCLGLLPVSNAQRGSFIDASVLRKLRDRLLEREQWNLALEVSTKAGLDITGVFAAWGKSCLKAGSLLLAREKFQRCLDKTGHYESFSDANSQSDFDTSQDSFTRGRNVSKSSILGGVSENKPAKNPPLLNEIVYILESKTLPISSEVLKSVKLTGSTLSLNHPTGSISQSDTAICIINKLKNLKNVSNGVYYEAPESDRAKMPCNRPRIDDVFYDECVYYLTKYGTHVSLLEFYVKHGDISKALNYIVNGQLSTEIFVDVYMKCLKDGVVNVLQEHVSRIDSTLNVWKDYLQAICRHLEKHNMLHSLYQLQQFMGDYIRAAMTCIRFYQEGVKCFTDLLANEKFLEKAENHLKEVLVQDQWVEVASVRRESVTSEGSYEEKSLANPSLVMRMSLRDINKNVETIQRQKEVVTFLAGCEIFDAKPVDLLSKILQIEDSAEKKLKIPTLFGGAQQKIHLAVLAIISGTNVEDGFNIALNVIQDFKLKPVKVYCEAGKQLAKAERYSGIAQLVSCIKGSGTNDGAITDMCDEMLTLAVATFTKANVSGTKVEDLIKLISDRATKISAYIEAKQLKTAYFLAVKYKRMSDIRRILREAELLNQPGIKALCLKVLHSHSHTPMH